MAEITVKCPECGMRTQVIVIEESSASDGTLVTLKAASPIYCPICGHPLARDMLEDEARRIVDG